MESFRRVRIVLRGCPDSKTEFPVIGEFPEKFRSLRKTIRDNLQSKSEFSEFLESLKSLKVLSPKSLVSKTFRSPKKFQEIRPIC